MIASPAAAPILLALAASPAPPEVRVTYLANEGVLIDGPCAVLVDALQRDSLGSYARHPPDVQEKLETARPPFDKVELALATHYHLDHWDPGAIARFLGSNPRAVFASTPEATAMMPYAVRERVKALRPAEGPRRRGFRPPARAWRRSRSNTGARRTSPTGSSAAGGSSRISATPTLRRRTSRGSRRAGPVDVAMVPFWWLTNAGGLAFLKDRWKPKHVVAFHVGGEDAESVPSGSGATCRRPGSARARASRERTSSGPRATRAAHGPDRLGDAREYEERNWRGGRDSNPRPPT